MATELNPDGVKRILCVVAHPDDLEYGVSTAVAAWTAAGIEVNYLLLTAGEAGMQREPEVVGPLRVREQRDACDIVGVSDLTVLDFPDGHLVEGLELRRAIAGHIRKIRPDVVVATNFEVEVSWGINHVDHRVVGLATADAIRDAGTRWIFREELGELEPWSAGRLLIGGYGDDEVDAFVDVTGEALDKGVASLEAHKEYLADLPDHPKPAEFIPAMAKGLGEKVGVEAAIGFRSFEM
ncbi:PIG-L deacetylase family protein [Corynebacterium doosanense]|uniref:GlcNAc-PI de-N-acetylase n=1 Tax=Corynebacterium doosanense CAU 212 = DSM 45436 TaxID=558173 RepID=A0A097IHA8_9CORY|nr:PIG-L deacetylase family protein [Corynebacterium doosanense]AIT61514.1 GlcNAc-PI de-N-acetylase [Corynebacterium doosanense CAU 212 = DSM 45436]